MDTPAAPAAVEPTSRSLVVEKHRVRRPVGPLYWLALVLLPVGMAAFVGFTQGPAIEDTLKADASAALKQAGYTGVTLVMDGRTITAKVPTGQDPQAVEDTLSGVPGVMSAEAEEVYASAKEARACENMQSKIDRATNKQRIPFVGESARLSATGQAMVREVGRLLLACRAADVTVGGHTDSSTFDGSDISLERARVIIRMLKAAGVESDRLDPRGYGDQFPIDDGDSKAARARNQRGSIAVKEQ
jgi:outer membrane protein OmpA-like peptidoglycan-associated protein